jgi:hypothetical protein
MKSKFNMAFGLRKCHSEKKQRVCHSEKRSDVGIPRQVLSVLICLAMVLMLSLTFVILSLYCHPELDSGSYLTKASAATTGECGDDSDPSYSSPNANATKVEYGGETWDVIGYNNNGTTNGISGPTDTATLLLDYGSYHDRQASYFSQSSNSNNYSGSDLQTAMNNYYNNVLTGDKSGIQPRNLTGGSGLSKEVNGYNSDTVAGSEVDNQYLWPLSLNEASQLKASVRSFESEWWLRSPGDSLGKAADVYKDGRIMSDEATVSAWNIVRPALYIKLSSLSSFSPSTANIGACPKMPQVTDNSGYTWDIIGYNNSNVSRLPAGKEGANTETANSATLVLSNSSTKKFAFKQKNGSYYDSTSIDGQYDSINCNQHIDGSTCSNQYSKSNLKLAMEDAYSKISSGLTESGLTPIARTLTGGSVNVGDAGYNSNNISGTTVSDAEFWPLSTAEAYYMNNQSRIFGSDFWWLRSAGVYPGIAAFVDRYGSVNFGGTVSGDVNDISAVRPAFQTALTSSIVNKINEAGGASIYTYNPDSDDPTPPTITCPTGQHLDTDGQTCVDDNPTPPTGECTNGATNYPECDNNISPTPDNPACSANQYLSNNQCINIPDCSTTEHLSNHKCIENTPTKLTWVNPNQKAVTLTTSPDNRQAYQLIASVTSSQGLLSNSQKVVTYSSSNKKVASVSSTGKIKVLKVGTSIITAKTKNGLKTTSKVTVKLPLQYIYNNNFIDIKNQDKTFKGYIKWMYNYGVTKGTTDITYSPNNPVRRDQMAMFIYRLVGSPDYTTKIKPFKDVKKKDGSYKSVMWLVNEKVTSGTDTKGHYSPDKSVTRMQMALFMYRLAGSPKEPTNNKYKVKDWNNTHNWSNEYKQAINFMFRTKTSVGVTINKKIYYQPNNLVTRAQMAAFMNRLYTNVLIK